MSKLRKALRILRNDGLGTLLRATWAHLRRGAAPVVPDECALVFAALDAARAPGIMVDVGAHHGTSLAPFARAGWRVLALEPDPVNRKRLEEEAADLPTVTIDARAASDHDEADVAFYSSDVSSGISGLQAFDASHQMSARVTLAPLSRILAEHRIDAVDFLKVDTEGFDLMVLRGLPLDTHAPRAIVVEFEDRKTLPLGYTYHDMARYLVDHGYRVVVSEWKPIVRYGTAHQWSRYAVYPHELASPEAWGNLVAVREPETYDRLLRAFATFERGRG